MIILKYFGGGYFPERRTGTGIACSPTDFQRGGLRQI